MTQDLKTTWTQQELVDLITDAEILGLKDSAGKCRICSEDRPVIISYKATTGIVTCCPECALDLEESHQFELEQLGLDELQWQLDLMNQQSRRRLLVR